MFGAWNRDIITGMTTPAIQRPGVQSEPDEAQLRDIVQSALDYAAQRGAEQKNSLARTRVLRSEDYLENVLAFTGLQE